MSVKDKLKEVLDSFELDSWLMHTMPEDEVYPDSFFTYLSIDAPFVAHYDNTPHSVVWAFWIGFYSNDANQVDSVPLELANRLRAAGWTVPGLGEDVQSDDPGWTGKRLTAYYAEKL